MKRKATLKPKLLIIHPGVQHVCQLANAAVKCERFSSVVLFTWFIIPSHSWLSKIRPFKKRCKELEQSVKICNFPVFELFVRLHRKLFPKQGNNSYYFWQYLFGIMLLPVIYLNRKDTVLVLFETAGFPLSRFAKRWNIRVIMDFPSISHEAGLKLGVSETAFGRYIKTQERQYIDYSFFCSNFASDSYQNKTSTKKSFVIPVGAVIKKKEFIPRLSSEVLTIGCIANTEIRKGLDILLSAYARLGQKKELHLIGSINRNWVIDYCKKNKIDDSAIFFSGPLPQSYLENYLTANQIELHVLPSRFDSFGMVVPETMVLGIPNILSPYVGAGELLQKDVDVFIMKDLTPASLQDEIKKYISLSSEDKVDLRIRVLDKAAQMSWEKYYVKAGLAFSEILNELEK